MNLRISTCLVLVFSASIASADPPVASYVFPAGGQRGQTVAVHVGGLFLHEECPFAVSGLGIQLSATLKRTQTRWFEGPLLPLPQSQQAEDYPQDMAGQIAIARDAPLGVRRCRVWTSQGAAPSVKFVVGDLPEVVETEVDGDAPPVLVRPPVTINGRIFPRENVDTWTVQAKKRDTYTCFVNAAGLGSPLDAKLEVYDASNRMIAENDDAHGLDPSLRFTAPADGVYQVRIRDSGWRGGQAYVYRLTIAAGPIVDRVFPLGGRRGAALKLDLVGHALPASTVDVTLPTNTNMCLADVPGKTLRPIWLDLDDVPEAIEGRDVGPAPLPTPVMLNGRIGVPGEVDAWSLAVKKGKPLTIETRAARLGSPLDAIVVIHDPADKEVARVEGDKSTEWTPAADGVYCLLVRDHFRSRGGPAFAYRVKVSPPRPDFRLALTADAATVLRKGQAKIKIDVARHGGFKDPIAITAENLPDGVTAQPLMVGANQTNAELTLKAAANATVSIREIRILGTPAPPKDKAKKDAKIEPPLPSRAATVATGLSEQSLDTMLVGVGIPTPFVIKGEYEMGYAARGGSQRRTYKIVRNGYDGPIEIRLADRQARHLQGVIGPAIVVPADKSEFVYEAYLPPWMELGRTCRVCVMGTATVKDEGREHRVVFTSTNQNEQLVAVVG
ncbi:MAG TPA: PPC domain-containing protein, partial [Gemmataceae bacterium]|nr:PPC domain-containing protein [Gemmataceae bacterium]